MIGPIAEFNADLWVDFAGAILLVWLVALALSAAGGWFLGRRWAVRSNDRDAAARWVIHFPGQPGLLLAAMVLPFLDLAWAATLPVLVLLLLPPTMLLALRVYGVHHDDPRQQRVDRRALLRTSWRDVGFLSAAFLIAGFAAYALVPEARDFVAVHMGNLPLALALALVIGTLVGTALSAANTALERIVSARQASGQYGSNLSALAAVRRVVGLLPSQFHGTPLTGVLIISAGVLPFSELSQTGVLAGLLVLPAISASFTARPVRGETRRDRPDRWHHWRLGLMNVMQICVGYLLGAAMLVPLADQHAWMLSDSDEVLRQLQTHLELTFIALGISMLLGITGGIVTSRVDVLRTVLINLGNVGRTIPSLAVLALALPIFGVGRAPSLVALVFISTLPILVNTSVGIIGVSSDLKAAAIGMGMQDWQVLLNVEIPVAMPVIMAGIRTSAVLVVASATLAGFIGGGGLGSLIIRGDGSGRSDILITGAVLATILSVFLEYFFGWLEILLTPRGLRET